MKTVERRKSQTNLKAFSSGQGSINQTSGDQFLNDLAAELAELLVPAGGVVGQLVVVESQEVQPGDVDVTDMVDALHRLGSDLIGRPDSMAGLAPASGKPHRHGLGVVVPAIAGAAAPDAIVGGTTERAAPNPQGILQHTPFLGVAGQGGDGFVDRTDE